MNQLEKIIKDHHIQHLGVEDYFFSNNSRGGSTVNVAFRTAIYILARKMGLPYTIISISAWKEFIANRGRPTKKHVEKWGKEPAKKLFIQEALYQNYGIRFPNHSKSTKTGNPIKFRNDIVDAVGQAIYLCKVHLEVQKIECIVELPPDHHFKTIPKGTYLYPEYEG